MDHLRNLPDLNSRDMFWRSCYLPAIRAANPDAHPDRQDFECDNQQPCWSKDDAGVILQLSAAVAFESPGRTGKAIEISRTSLPAVLLICASATAEDFDKLSRTASRIGDFITECTVGYIGRG